MRTVSNVNAARAGTPTAPAAESFSLNFARVPGASSAIGLEFVDAKESTAWPDDAGQNEENGDSAIVFPSRAATNDAAIRMQSWEREGASAAAIATVGLPQLLTLTSEDVGAPIGIADRSLIGKAVFLPVAIPAGEQRPTEARMGRRSFLRWLWSVPAMLHSLTRRKDDRQE